MTEPLQILEKYWGFTSFRPLQEEIIQSVMDGQDTVALLPTSGGKSICFQVPALAKDGICIVVSPLVALMADQVNALKDKGIKALQISGGISYQDLEALLDNAKYGNFKFLYLSPERLQQELVQNAIKQMPVNLIAVDEAHCISQWGNDFRPAYKNITILREIHPLVPAIALTATATPKVLADTISELKLELPNIFQASFARENISYQVFKIEDKLYRIQQLLKNGSGKSIIYVRSRNSCVEISNQLNSLGIASTFYHGGISSEGKTERMHSWQHGTTPNIVATNAFGMGIDEPDVRLVVHVQLPDSLEAYFQEAGRAGRDGKMAKALILWSDYDKQLVHRQFVASYPTTKDVKYIYKKLNNYFQVPYGEGEFTSYPFNFSDFCKTYELSTLLAFNSLQILDRLGVLQLSKSFGRKSIVHFVASSNVVLEYFKKDMLASVIGKTILRLYGGVFETATSINLQYVATKSGQNITTIIKVLEQMERDALLTLQLQVTDAVLTFSIPREDEKTINPLSKEIALQKEKKESQVKAVLDYIDNDTTCRSLQLVRYFGEENATKCGICSVCKSEFQKISAEERKLLSEKILLLLEETPQSSRELSEKLTFAETEIVATLRLLLDSKKVSLGVRNRYHLK
ncbi:RecQ family ATP-dependent DNA helicase [Rasiella sp. SM2506]|uniref:RecQ family ATP-dependent DNA helicase n=1 Tax=Rasiella sp. SM2506 TaxID=3423914 RepID=UPI003D7B8A89